MLYILIMVKVYSFVNAQQNVHLIACKYISELFWWNNKYGYFWVMELKIIFIFFFISVFLNSLQ